MAGVHQSPIFMPMGFPFSSEDGSISGHPPGSIPLKI